MSRNFSQARRVASMSRGRAPDCGDLGPVWRPMNGKSRAHHASPAAVPRPVPLEEEAQQGMRRLKASAAPGCRPSSGGWPAPGSGRPAAPAPARWRDPRAPLQRSQSRLLSPIQLSAIAVRTALQPRRTPRAGTPPSPAHRQQGNHVEDGAGGDHQQQQDDTQRRHRGRHGRWGAKRSAKRPGAIAWERPPSGPAGRQVPREPARGGRGASPDAHRPLPGRGVMIGLPSTGDPP